MHINKPLINSWSHTQAQMGNVVQLGFSIDIYSERYDRKFKLREVILGLKLP